MVLPFSWCFGDQVADDSYSVVAEYFGRGLFNKLTVVTSEPELTSQPSFSTPVPVPAPTVVPATSTQRNYGPGAEAKLRLQEGQSKQVYAPNQPATKGTAIVPIPEGRMRVMEQKKYTEKYSSSIEANLTNIEPSIYAVRNSPKQSPFASPLPGRRKAEPISAGTSPKISSSIANEAGKNPFEEETYDEQKNPFADDKTNDPTNPFSEDDYDKNLNPFS